MDSIQNDTTQLNSQPILGVQASRSEEVSKGKWSDTPVSRDNIKVGDNIMFSSEQSFHTNIARVQAILAQKNLALAPKKLPEGKTRAQWTQVSGFPVTRVSGVSKKSGRPYTFYKAWVCSMNPETQSTF